MTATIQTDASADDFARLEAETERRCPVSQMFVRSGLQFRSTWTQVQTAAAVA